MDARKVSPGRGWGWITEGWTLFMKNPLMWVVMIVLYVVIAVVLTIIPFIGGLAYALIAPALAGGMLYGAAQLEAGGELEVGQLFQAFKNKALTGPMLTLGGLSLVGGLLAALLGGGLMFGSMMGMGGMDALETASPADLESAVGAGLLAMLVTLVVGAALFALLFYAVPLVMLGGAAPMDAIKSSAAGCVTNWLPLLVFGLIYGLLAFLAAIPFMLGFLVLGPVTVAAVYRSYVEVFGSEATA